MDKLIQLGVEARRHDTKISQIELKAYSGEISPDQAIDLVEKELVRYNLVWGKIMKKCTHEHVSGGHDGEDMPICEDCGETPVDNEVFMLEQHLLALPN